MQTNIYHPDGEKLKTMIVEEIIFPHRDAEELPERDEYIYLESENYQAYNDYISANYDHLQCEFIVRDHTLDYLPVICQQLSHGQSLRYYAPGITPDDRQQLLRFSTADYTRLLAGPDRHLTPMLARYLRRNGRTDIWQAVYFEPDSPPAQEFQRFFDYLDGTELRSIGMAPELHECCVDYKISSDQYRRRIDVPRFSLAEDDAFTPPTSSQLPAPCEQSSPTPCEQNLLALADDTWDDDMRRAAQLAMASVRHLREHGVRESIIRQLLDVNIKPSPVVVREDYTIFLPDYNMEFDFTPVQLAVYVLFLSHPEGIYLKRLSEYQKELEGIYRTVTKRINEDSIQKTISSICDPLSNSINEHCARIRTKIFRKMHESLADHYCITGLRGEAKSIAVAGIENMVVWE